MNVSLESAIAVVRDEQSGQWLQFSGAIDLLVASSAAEVEEKFQRLQALVDQGYYAVGYVAYEAAPAFDASLPVREAKTPLLCFAVFKEPEPISLPEAVAALPLYLSTTLARDDYLEKVTAIRQHLEAGDSYQVNLTHTLRGHLLEETNPLAIFATLFGLQASPRSVFFQQGDTVLCSVSPELFFELDADRITMEPMKGTRPRHHDSKLDARLRQELLDSEKEKAENLMIVDMVRNDLGKIARAGSVGVDALFEIMELPTLWQQVSRVSASTDASLWEIFRALFPCASITGAPKRQSMNIIKSLETEARGIYTGAIGLIRPGRRAHFNVGIRTLVINTQTNDASYGVGSAVVWDSEGPDEWLETLDKARIVRAVPNFELLETMLFVPGQGIALRDFHLQRLQNSADYFATAIHISDIQQDLDLIDSDLPLRLRLLVDSTGQHRIEHAELNPAKEEVTLVLATLPVNSQDPFLQHKTTHRQVYESAMATAGQADDVLLWNERGELTETTIYNVFLEFDGELLTPALSSGLLAGTLRRSLIETGKAREAILGVEALADASRILVGNSVRGLIPARMLATPENNSHQVNAE